MRDTSANMTRTRRDPLSSCVAAAALVLGAVAGCGGDSASSAGAISRTGQGGSLARFTVVGNYLYTVDGQRLHLFDVTDPANPSPWTRQEVGFGIETIFGYGDHLFIGSQTGVYIYDNTNPQFPKKLGALEHVRSCDPVVVEGTTAYVTLRNTGSRCRGGDNELDIIDIANPAAPSLVMSYAMEGPAGLGIDGGTLFVCDSTAGLKVFDATDPLMLELVDRVTDQNCYDVIPRDGVLIVSGLGGLSQYDYKTLPMTLLSKL